jgi:hypothetical protein
VWYVTLTFWFQPGLLGKNYLNLLPKTWDITLSNSQTPTPALTELNNMHHHDWKYSFVFKLSNNEAAHKIEQSFKITCLLRRPQMKQENAPPRWHTLPNKSCNTQICYKTQYLSVLSNKVSKQVQTTGKVKFLWNLWYWNKLFVLPPLILFQ